MKKYGLILGVALLAGTAGHVMAAETTTTVVAPGVQTTTTTTTPEGTTGTAPAPQQVIVPVGPPAVDAITGKPVKDTSTANDDKKEESLRDKVRAKMEH